MKNLEIIITLEEDNKTINFVNINGSEHYMFEESKEEKEMYQNMTVREFITEYVDYYNSTKEEEENEYSINEHN